MTFKELNKKNMKIVGLMIISLFDDIENNKKKRIKLNEFKDFYYESIYIRYFNNKLDTFDIYVFIKYFDEGKLCQDRFNLSYFRNKYLSDKYDKKYKLCNDFQNLKQKHLKKINLSEWINTIMKIVDNQIEQELRSLQAISVCNNLIKSKFRRPFNLTEDILCEY